MRAIRAHIDASSARPIVGFSLYWAWIDAALVGAPLARSVAENTLFGDLTSMISVLFCILVYLLCYRVPALSEWTRSRPVRWTIAALASAGAVLVSLGGTRSLGMMAGGLALIGLGMGAIVLMWAEDYASDEQGRGYIWVAGSIALSFPIYLVAVELSDWMRIVTVAALPLASCALLAPPRRDLPLLPKAERTFVARSAADDESAGACAVMGFPRNVAFWFAAFGFVFGIMQRFSNSPVLLDPVLMDFQQGGRALAAVVFFVGLCVFSWKPHTVYRLSTSIVLVGLVLVPIFGSDGNFAAGFIAHMAYGFFECMSWSIVFEIMRARRSDAGATAGAARLLSSVGLLTGTLAVVVARTMFAADALQMQSILSSSVCILVIATMMVLDTNSDDNVWAMMKAGSGGSGRRVAGPDAEGRDAGAEAADAGSGADDAQTDGRLQRSAAALGRERGLTERETQILALLAQGRTSPYISKELLIGVNTVNTHKRRIYQKLGVHDKQELIDMVADLPPEPRRS